MTTKISELPTGQAVGNIINETVRVHSGATTAATPSVTLERSTSDSSTNTVPTVLRLKRTTTGTPATGIGAALDFEVETSAANNEIGARIEAVTTDVTGTSEDFDLRLLTQVAGSTTLVEGLRIRGPRGTTGAAEFDDGYVSFFQSKTDAFNRTTGNRTVLWNTATGTVNSSSGAQYGWSATAAGGDVGLTLDTGMGRHSAAVAKVTNGSTTIHALFGGGAAIASAATLPVPTGRVCHVTGTTGITNISATNFGAGVVVTLIFDGILTLTDGGNMRLAGNFTTSADDTLTLVWDGSAWFECSRSVN